jgi:uncharacterized protein YjbI with pentapeptide repeats
MRISAGLASVAPPQGGESKRCEARVGQLSGANLSRAYLSGAALEGANLRGADLGGATLIAAKFMRANLSLADLSRANLGGADLDTVDLNGANLDVSNFGLANLSNAQLTGVHWQLRTMRGCYLGIRGLDSCFGNALFKRRGSRLGFSRHSRGTLKRHPPHGSVPCLGVDRLRP